MLEKMRAGAADPNPLLSAYPTFFHRLSVTAEEVAFHIGTDAKEGPDGYQEWYSVLKNNFTKKATKAAAAEVDEKWLTWKANELDRLAMTFQREIGAKAREKGKSYFIETAERLGLQVVQAKAPTEPTPPPPPPTTGRKRTASGLKAKNNTCDSNHPGGDEDQPSTCCKTKHLHFACTTGTGYYTDLPNYIARRPLPYSSSEEKSPTSTDLAKARPGGS